MGNDSTFDLNIDLDESKRIAVISIGDSTKIVKFEDFTQNDIVQILLFIYYKILNIENKIKNIDVKQKVNENDIISIKSREQFSESQFEYMDKKLEKFVILTNQIVKDFEIDLAKIKENMAQND